MTTYATVRLTPWAAERIIRDYCTRSPLGPGKPARVGKVSKTAIRQSLKDLPGTEFHTVETPVMRGGAVLTVDEAKEDGIDVLEVRFNDDRSVAMIDVRTGRVS